MSFKWPNKDPDETLDYSMDWSRFLGFDHLTATGATINGNLTSVAGTLRDSTNTVCTIRFSAGTNNTTYKITSQITDSTGLVSERVVRLRIKEN